MNMKKFILDASCGGRMIWFDKCQPNTIYIDNNPRPNGIVPDRPNFKVSPDVVMDFRDLKFPDKSFKLVVWDPPHMKIRAESIMARKYGFLTDSWKEDLTKGFNECWRVLDDYGVLILKWSSTDYRAPRLNDLLELFSSKPLFGHRTGSKSKTYWLCFMRIED